MLKQLENSPGTKERTQKKPPFPLPLTPKPDPSPCHKPTPSLTFLSINVIQEVDGVLHNTVADIAIIASEQKETALGQI